ncbi:hypothetical protein BA78_8823 [Aspergillus fumigatus]|nr:hypothetical protein BA78_8823 [Aspergillus fumigatus]
MTAITDTTFRLFGLDPGPPGPHAQQLDEAFALLPYVVAPSVSLLRALADELTRSISSTSSPSRAWTQPTSSSIFRIQILRLVEIPISTGTEILWALQ